MNSQSSPWSNVPVFVTGANGFVGSWVARRLVDEGARVFALIRTVHPNGGLKLQGIEDRVSIIFGDLLDYDRLEATIAENDIAFVFHLAAQAIVKHANLAPRSTVESNVLGTMNILEAVRTCRPIIRGVVVASSDKAYGDHGGEPYKETDALLGGAPYEASKAATDLLAQSYSRTFDLPIAVARFCNIFGGGDLNFSRKIPEALLRLHKEDRLVYFTPSKHFVREYMYVEDAVDGYLTLARNILGPDSEKGKAYGEASNFGTGNRLSPLPLLKLIAEVAGIDGSKICEESREERNRKVEIPEQTLDSSKVQETLGWYPKWSMHQALKVTFDWYRDYLSKAVS